MNPESKSHLLYENLDTTFVNLWALLRNLSQRGFIGRVHIEMPDYTADVFINGSATPLVREMDRAAGTETLEEGGLHRLVLRVRETPGTISVFEGEHEAAPSGRGEQFETIPGSAQVPAARQESSYTMPAHSSDLHDHRETDDRANDKKAPRKVATPLVTNEVLAEPKAQAQPEPATRSLASRSLPAEPEPINQFEWDAIVKSGGELMAAVERVVTTAGADFNALFSAARLALADDYPFLDPTSNELTYANSAVSVKNEVPVSSYVAGISEVLRRMVDRFATGDRARGLRERVALELLSVARKREEILTRSGFRSQLDRIAGTKVL